MEFEEHKVQWTDEKVKRFWDFYNNNAAFEDLWFSKAVGKGIINLVKRKFPITGTVLDYGIGKGHFADYLIQDKGIELYACDFSSETVNNVNARFDTNDNFKGCSLVTGFPSTFAENTFDIVFLIESIEHLTDDYLLPTLSEVNRILKTGGKLVITTPNSEPLGLQEVICPDCGCIFHRVQHVRSFDRHSLSKLVGEFGFSSIYCDATDFHEYGSNGAIYKIKNAAKKSLQSSYVKPHLMYLGSKK